MTGESWILNGKKVQAVEQESPERVSGCYLQQQQPNLRTEEMKSFLQIHRCDFQSLLSSGSLRVAELKRKRPCPHREYKDLFFQTILCFPLRKNDFFFFPLKIDCACWIILCSVRTLLQLLKARFASEKQLGRGEAFLCEMHDCLRVSFELCLQFSINSFEINRSYFSYCCRAVPVSLYILAILRK